MRARYGALCMCVVVATLGVPRAATRAAASTILVAARPLTPPSTAHTRVMVDMLDIRPQSLSWSHAGSGFVKIYAPGEVHPYPRRFPAIGRFAVPTSELSIGRSTFFVSYCKPSAGRGAPLCSAGTPVTFDVGPAEFRGPYRKFVPDHENLQLSWSGSGDVWHLVAPSLGISAWLTKPSFAIPAAGMTAGVHEISVVSCFFASRPRCSNRVDVMAAAPGTVQFTAADGARVAAGQIVGRVTPDHGGAIETLTARRAGVLHRLVANGTRIDAHVSAARVITADVGRSEIVAGGASVPTWTKQDWQRAFTARTYDDSAHPSTGSPLDITFDSAGGIWQVGEFSQAIAHVQDGRDTAVASPVGQGGNPASGNAAVAAASRAISQTRERTVGNRGVPVRRAARLPGASGSALPYAMNIFGSDLPTSMSVLGERVIDTGSAVWYTQGGELFYDGAHPNHSTLIKVAYRGTRAAGHRVCALAVPGDNNQVIGVAYDPTTNRVWFTESHAGRASALDWFVDDGTIPCNNNLNYSSPGRVAAVSAANRCRKPTQTGCMHHIDLPLSAGRAGHITVDPSGGYAWFVDFTGRQLNRYPLRGGVVESFPLPASVSASLFNGFPWAIQADASAVYLNRYSDNTLLRFDSNVANPTIACATLIAGTNPCISELFLPMPGRDANAHSIALVGNRLWFTIANESSRPTHPDGSTFGYIDTTSWAAGTPTGVYYDNLTTLATRPPNAHHSFRGIAVTSSGTIALADSGYKQTISLTPK